MFLLLVVLSLDHNGKSSSILLYSQQSVKGTRDCVRRRCHGYEITLPIPASCHLAPDAGARSLHLASKSAQEHTFDIIGDILIRSFSSA